MKVNKSVALYGTGAVIESSTNGFYVTADDATVDGFTIHAADKGIRLDEANNVTLNNNRIENAQIGIYIMGSQSTQITNNVISGSSLNGMSILYSNDSSVSGNIISDSENRGIYVDNSKFA